MTDESTGRHDVIVPGAVPTVTHAELRKAVVGVVSSILAAGVIGAVTLGTTAWVSLHDVQTAVADVREDYLAADEREVSARVRWQESHRENGHRATRTGLHQIEIQLAAIKTELAEVKERLPRRR